METTQPFRESEWKPVDGFDFTDITYHRYIGPSRTGAGGDIGAVRIAFDRPEVRNAFRPHTVDELYTALEHARCSSDVGTVLITGNGPSTKDGGWAFCSGGDQRVRGRDGYLYESGGDGGTQAAADRGRLHVLEVQRLIRVMPKVVVAVVNGWGRRRGPLAARGVRPDHRLPPARHVQADRRHGRLLRRRVRVGAAGPPGGAEARPRDLLPRAGPHRRGDAGTGRGQPRGRPRRSGGRGGAHGHRHRRPVAAGDPDAQVRVQPARRRHVRPAALRRRGDPDGYMTDEAVEGKTAFLDKRSADWSAFPRYF